MKRSKSALQRIEKQEAKKDFINFLSGLKNENLSEEELNEEIKNWAIDYALKKEVKSILNKPSIKELLKEKGYIK